jgi:hypothetical protein
MSNIRLQIIGYKKGLYYYAFSFLLGMLIVYWLLIFLIVIVYPEGHNGIIFKIGLIWLLLMVVLSIIKKTYYIIDVITLNDEYIEIDRINTKYHLKELRDLTIDIGGYRWQPHITGRIVTFSNGINNTLSFEAKGQRFIYRFLIKNRKELKSIQEYIKNIESIKYFV